MPDEKQPLKKEWGQVMQEYDPEKYVDIQRKDWNQAAAAWEKWDRWLDENMAHLNHHLIDLVGVDSGHRTLDLGSGTGYPALIAAQKVGTSGSVVGLDLSGNMLAVARKKSTALGLANTTFQTCDVRSIPFDDNSFDAITSRFCFMFLPHLAETLSETYRTLKPGAKMAVAVWAAPEKNPGLTLAVKVMKEFIDIPAPDLSLPGLFALAPPDKLKSAMETIGYSGVNENEVEVNWSYASGAEYVESFREIAAPLKPLFNSLADKDQVEVTQKLSESAEEYRDGDALKMPGMAVIVDGEKP